MKRVKISLVLAVFIYTMLMFRIISLIYGGYEYITATLPPPKD
jgi:hypothetical protein